MISSRACLSLQSKGHKSFKQKIKQEMFSDKSVVGLTTLPLCNVTREETRQEKEHHHCFPIELPFHKKPTGSIYMTYTLGLLSELHYAISSSQFFTLYLPNLISQVTIYSHHLVIVGEVVLCSLTSIAWEMPLWNPSYFFLLKKKLTCEMKTAATHVWQ